jgi:alpha-ribazole phosphatase
LSEFNIYLLRHGELVQTGILCGRTDIGLSSVGKQQLIDATNKLPKISHCFSSPLIRCREFAETFCQKTGLSLQVSPQLQEMDFGDWDGQSYQSLWAKNTALDDGTSKSLPTPTLGAFWQDPWQCLPPNGESMDSFIKRVDVFWLDIIEQLQKTEPEEILHAENAHKERSPETPQPKNALVFSHGGVIRYLLAKVLQLPMPGTAHMTNIDVPYGALVHIQIFVDNEGNVWPKLKL